MSNYCKSCPYNPKTTTDKDSCPFNSLYWDFIDKNKNIFKKNPRMSLMLKIWNQKDETDKVSILKKAQNIKKCLHNKEIL
jgi:deoxyribodipyrimidine photolyase-related protein